MPPEPLPPPDELRDEALRVLYSIMMTSDDDEARVEAAVAILAYLSARPPR